MLQALIFDLDGVLVDTHAAHKEAWKAFLRSVGREASEKELSFILEGQTREDILRHFLGDLTPEQLESYGARKAALFRDTLPKLKLIPGIRRFLNELRAAGLPSAVGSSGSRERVELLLEQHQLRHHFQAVATGDDVAKGKPDPAVFHLAAQGLNVPPEHILVCEDAICGVMAAKRAEMKCLGIAAEGRAALLAHSGADRVCADFTSVRLEEVRQLFDRPYLSPPRRAQHRRT